MDPNTRSTNGTPLLELEPLAAPRPTRDRNTVYVAIDLETTGLNTDRDEIIEVGAVRFRRGEVLDEFSTLVRPPLDVPLRVTQITGLTRDHLASAPKFGDISDDLALFIGDAPIVGQSVAFDLRFLSRRGLVPNAVALDTYELATIVLPSERRYGLSHLCRLLDVPLTNAHRALPDAHAHRMLFERLLDLAAALPVPVLETIDQLARDSTWPLAAVFASALDEVRGKGLAPALDAPTRTAFIPAAGAPPRPLEPRPSPPRLDAAELEERLARAGEADGADGPDGADGAEGADGADGADDADGAEGADGADSADGAADSHAWEDRPGQREMLREVAAAFNDSARLFVEAGTGTGKTIAYLIPAAAWARESGRRVVISTHTIALQEQLLAKDIPMVQRLIPGTEATVLKGRSHYLCRTRLASLERRTGLDDDSLRAAAKILVWAHVTETGDRTELRLQPEEMNMWRSVSAEGEACTNARCPYARAGTCWVHRARRRAESSHLVVVNHALLVSDMRVEHRLLPVHDRLIIDEAHHLEDVATSALGFRCSPTSVAELFADVGAKGRRLMPRVDAAVAVLAAEPDLKADLTSIAAQVNDAASSAADRAAGVFTQVKAFHRERSDGEADVRLTAAMRADPSWQEVEVEWDALDRHLEDALRGIEVIMTSLGPFHDELVDPSLPADLFAARRDLVELRRELGAIVGRPGPNDVCWATSGGREKLALARAPLEVSDVLSRRLFADKETVVLTSATLRDNDGFGLIGQRLGLPDADSAVVPSPFDFAANVLLFLPNDMPDLYHSDHAAAVCRAIVDAAAAARGRTLVLFTSHSELRDAYHRVRGPLGDLGIAVLGQGLDGSRHNILDGFRDPGTRTVLMGTRSFWEGIDVPGDSLSCLLITRLPFDVPTEPVFNARADTFEDSFGEYALPSAVLRFRQGFGRLIRTATDRGVVAVLDGRIQSRAYGDAFLEALPPVQKRVGALGELGGAVGRFLSAAEIDVADRQPLFHEIDEENGK